MTSSLDDGDDLFWRRFHYQSIPEKEWTHRAHLRTAWLHLRRHAFDEAHLLLRVAIVRLNAAHGLVETPARGYHETLTVTWLHLVDAAMKKSPHFSDSSSFVDAHASALEKSAPLRHYSRELLNSVKARARFIEPDVMPFV